MITAVSRLFVAGACSLVVNALTAQQAALGQPPHRTLTRTTEDQ
jgi:hypothetical protein